jgi:hypothetical protein
MSEAALKALSNSELASGSEIPAVKHRTVNDAIIEEMFDGQSRGDVLAAVQSALSLSAGDKVFVIRSGQAYLLDANSFGLVSNLVDLSDVQITSPVNGQSLVYDAGLNKYVLKDIFLDVSWQEPIISFLNFTTSEPASPTTGDRYVNTVTGSGSVSTGETFTINYIYEWNGVDWTETVPLQGYTLVNNDDSLIYNFNGTSWVAASSGALPSNIAYKDTDNNFSTGQTINGTLSTTGLITSLGDITFVGVITQNSNQFFSTDSQGWVHRSNQATYSFLEFQGSGGADWGGLYATSTDIGFVNTNAVDWRFRIDSSNNVDIVGGSVYLNGVLAMRKVASDGWLYLNDTGVFTNGVYTLGLMRADGGFEVGGLASISSTGVFNGNGSGLTNVNTFHSVADLGTNQTAVSANSARELDILAGLYNASTTLTFSDVTNLRRCAIQITNTNANVLTFAGITVKFVAAELPSGMSFASNALTFSADTAVVYNIVLEKFNGTTFRGRIELD